MICHGVSGPLPTLALPTTTIPTTQPKTTYKTTSYYKPLSRLEEELAKSRETTTTIGEYCDLYDIGLDFLFVLYFGFPTETAT